jgi:hypothetical protein
MLKLLIVIGLLPVGGSLFEQGVELGLDAYHKQELAELDRAQAEMGRKLNSHIENGCYRFSAWHVRCGGMDVEVK